MTFSEPETKPSFPGVEGAENQPEPVLDRSKEGEQIEQEKLEKARTLGQQLAGLIREGGVKSRIELSAIGYISESQARELGLERLGGRNFSADYNQLTGLFLEEGYAGRSRLIKKMSLKEWRERVGMMVGALLIRGGSQEDPAEHRQLIGELSILDQEIDVIQIVQEKLEEQEVDNLLDDLDKGGLSMRFVEEFREALEKRDFEFVFANIPRQPAMERLRKFQLTPKQQDRFLDIVHTHYLREEVRSF